jgi:epoxyqueuosine reductase
MVRPKAPWSPTEEQRALWPALSGNTINGVGEAAPRRPSPIYWHAPDATPHGPLQRWFYGRTASASPAVAEARAERQAAIDAPLGPLAAEAEEASAETWTDRVLACAREAGAGDAGVAAMRAEYAFEGHPVPPQRWMVMLAIGQDHAAMMTAPSDEALVEVTRQYARGMRVAKAVATWLRARGHDAVPYAGPMAGSFTLIPAAIEAGLGELGKHGSLIHRALGSNFRLACVLTDVPLVAGRPDAFGADAFCASCRICMDACPPDAIQPVKQLVRGERRWYVDFDKCLPYFNEHLGCAICLPVCPFSRPVIGPRLAAKLARR